MNGFGVDRSRLQMGSVMVMVAEGFGVEILDLDFEVDMILGWQSKYCTKAYCISRIIRNFIQIVYRINKIFFYNLEQITIIT